MNTIEQDIIHYNFFFLIIIIKNINKKNNYHIYKNLNLYIYKKKVFTKQLKKYL